MHDIIWFSLRPGMLNLLWVNRAAGHFLKRILLKATPGAAGVVCCALSAMVANYFGTPDAVASTMAVLSAGVIGLGNLILTCRPFSKLRIAVCTAMSAGFVCAAAFLPDLFKLGVQSMTARHWIMLSAITAAGVAVLILGTLLVQPKVKKLES